jgi:uncharacterized membrane protein YgaE (UPF0421/DUF939 family)
LIRGGTGLVTEAGVSAVLVANLDPTTYGVSPDRFLEALVGGGVALAVSAALPSNPSMRARQAARPVLEDLATALRDAAAALIGGDLPLAQSALSEARRIDTRVAQLREELDGSYQVARLSPARRRHPRYIPKGVQANSEGVETENAVRETYCLSFSTSTASTPIISNSPNALFSIRHLLSIGGRRWEPHFAGGAPPPTYI